MGRQRTLATPVAMPTFQSLVITRLARINVTSSPSVQHLDALSIAPHLAGRRISIRLWFSIAAENT